MEQGALPHLIIASIIVSAFSITERLLLRFALNITNNQVGEFNGLNSNAWKLTKKPDDCYELQKWEGSTSVC